MMFTSKIESTSLSVLHYIQKHITDLFKIKTIHGNST